MLNGFLIKLADQKNKQSLSKKFREKRMKVFFDFISSLPKPIKILDVGGTENFWEALNITDNNDYFITILNINPPGARNKNIITIKGDATNMKEFPDNAFDIVFSNSVIEHVGDYEKQKKMAEEIKRIGKKYFIQTPNFYFPVEPHFLFPFFQFMPLRFRIFLIKKFNLGWRKKQKNKEDAKKEAMSVRLLTKSELKKLFPGAKIYKEKILGLTKSFSLYR